MTSIKPEHYDVVVIGAGPAGERGAVKAADFGKKVALIEKEINPGGACSNTGTLPSKTFRESVLHLSGLASRGLSSIRFELNETVTAKDLLHKNAMVIRSDHERFHRAITKHGIDYISGMAKFVDPHTVHILNSNNEIEKILSADFFLIATGSIPNHPPGIPFDKKILWDSDTVLDLERIPKSLIVVGGGVIGAEYSSIFAALGVEVYLVDGRTDLLGFLDREIAKTLMVEMGKLGVRFHLGHNVDTYRKTTNNVSVKLSNGEALSAEALLVTAGRNGNTKNLGLENVGLTADKRGALKVNENYQTEVPHIYAAGDVIGFPALASTSMDQGRLSMCHAFKQPYIKRLPEHLPVGIYTIPEVSVVGESEESAKAKGIDVEVGIARFIDNARAEIMGEMGGILKLVFDANTRVLIGAHIVCERASEVIVAGLMGVRMGVKIDFFIDTVFNYPTLSEAYKSAAYNGIGRLAMRKSLSK